MPCSPHNLPHVSRRVSRSVVLASLLLCGSPLLVQANEQALADRDAQNKRWSQQMLERPKLLPPPLEAQYNHIVTFGQSLASAAEGWPALSKKPGYDNLMLGDSTRSATFSGDRFVPVGGAAFKPLRAVVQLKRDPKVLLDSAAVAALKPHDQEEGESVEVGALNMARHLYLQDKGLDADPAHLLVASNAATSGRSIAQLSKVGGTQEYKRVLQAVDQARQVAESSGASYSLSAFFWLQGEYDYAEVQGGINDKQRYKTALRQLRDDLYRDTARAFGQVQMPAFISYQTDAKTSVVNGSLDIGMAQWELAREEPNWYLAGPVYPYVDQGTHLTANGYRWFGQMLGKVYHQVVVQRRGWQPLSPLGATQEGREILIDFHVPHPPLAFSEPYIGHQAQMIENYGFVITDDQGKVPVENIEAAADTVLRLVTARDLVGTPTIRYASQAAGGAGELHDSDPTVADAQYEYLPDEGMPAEANIDVLVGKPYPLQNWCIAFELVPRRGHDSAR
ncbi:sialate O-acetylesterase [Stutzerimonas stutzeri]|uniref:sialate O-acetylesterase n=1 Tax=Stutzerimonas stutzeri TaxID=316 RepID=UPI001C2EC454|nr:sialate O-acetylesterase [Stutzerimonas stutzeri]